MEDKEKLIYEFLEFDYEEGKIVYYEDLMYCLSKIHDLGYNSEIKYDSTTKLNSCFISKSEIGFYDEYHGIFRPIYNCIVKFIKYYNNESIK